MFRRLFQLLNLGVTASARSVVALSSTIVASLLSARVATMGAPVMAPPPSLASPVPPSVVLTSTSSSSSSCPHVPLHNIYTSNDVDSLCGIGYKPKQKTLVGFVLAFHKNLI